MPGYNPHTIEPKWQRIWEEHKTFRATEQSGKPKLYVLDMFPYPSGEGLHVGHPEGYTATDMWCRYKRMRGYAVLHPMGYDAFGLPAEQYAIQTGTHPRVTTEKNIQNIRRQIKRLGFSYDWDREFATTDTEYVRWTQWIFLVLFDTWFDGECRWVDAAGQERRGRGRPIAELPIPDTVRSQGESAIRRYQDSRRLAYMSEAPVNWCAELGTVLADEEVIDGRSERGDHPVQRIPLRQWMLRITAYADRLVQDLESLDWPGPIKEMQRNWVGRSEGAEVDFYVGPADGWDGWRTARRGAGFPPQPDSESLRIYTTRPDTLFGATYMVLAPEHPWVDRLTSAEQSGAVNEYRRRVASMSEEDRIAGRGEKTGVATGGFAINPVNGARIPVWIADYVLVSYGTGAIMAVPGQDERDWDFAEKFNLPIIRTVQPPDGFQGKAYLGDGPAIHSEFLDGLEVEPAKRRIIEWLVANGLGCSSVKYKLRDWLFSRQRYWGEPFPILHQLDDNGNPIGLTRAVAFDELPVCLPDLEDYKPTGRPEPPLAKATDWANVERGGKRYRRETNTMPQWAGSCWYYLRFCDARNTQQAWDANKERYWMPVDLYVGGAEHAVLHLLYSRFWHKVLFDRGHVSTLEPFQRLINQGMILSITYRDASGRVVPYTKIKFGDGAPVHAETGEVLEGETEKMAKSRGNVVPVDIPISQYGADTTRLYEMFMGPLEATKPWSMQGVEGISRFLNRAWRLVIDEGSETMRLNPAVTDDPPSDDQLRTLHKTIQVVSEDMEGLRFNTAISRLMEFVNFFTGQASRPRACIEPFVRMLAPLAPHIAEEMWQTLGQTEPLAFAPWPDFDPARVRDDTIEVPVQINGKLRSRVVVAADCSREQLEAAALADEKIQAQIAGKTIRKVIVVPGKLVNIVVG